MPVPLLETTPKSNGDLSFKHYTIEPPEKCRNQWNHDLDFFCSNISSDKKKVLYISMLYSLNCNNNNNNVFYLMCFCVTFCGPSVFILLQFLVAAAQWQQAALPLSTPPTSVKHSTVNSVWFEVDTHAKTLSSAFFI